MTSIGALLNTVSAESYYDKNPREIHELPAVTVKTPVKPVEHHSNMLLWVAAGAAALFFFRKKL